MTDDRGLRRYQGDRDPRMEEHALRREPAIATRGWDEARFLAAVETIGGHEDVAVCRRLLDWCQSHVDRVEWGSGRYWGYMLPVIGEGRHRVTPFQPWVGPRSTGIEINFQSLKRHPPFDDDALRQAALDRLRGIPGVDLEDAGLDGRPSIPMHSLAEETAMRGFLTVMEGVVSRLRGRA